MDVRTIYALLVATAMIAVVAGIALDGEALAQTQRLPP
jgi:hypothetical protein